MAKSLSRYALLTGRPGGQTQIGGTATGEHLTLKSNTLGDGLIKFGDNIVVDEANTRLGIGTTSPGSTLVVQSSEDLIASFRTTGSSVDSILKISVANNDSGLNRAYTWYQVEDAATNWYTGVFKNNTDGNESFSISSTGNNLANSQFVINKSGLVGVGPSNPLEKLDVAGNAQLRNSTTATNFYVHNNYTNSTTYERLRVGWATNVAIVGTEKGSVGGTARSLALQTDGTTRLTVGSTGGVTINSGAIYANSSGGYSFDGNTTTYMRSDSANRIDFYTGNTRRMSLSGAALITDNTSLTVGGGEFTVADGSTSILYARNNPGVVINESGVGHNDLRVEGDTLTHLLFTDASADRVGINESLPDYLLDVNGAIGFTPGASVTPVDNGDVVFEFTNNTTLTVKAKGSDGVVRSGTVTLA